MNKRMIAYTLGILLLAEGFLMCLPLIVGIIYHEKAIWSIAVSIAALALSGLLCLAARPKNKIIYAREGFIIVSLGWILISLFGALPFFLSGSIPNYLDAVFESVSGFTTTGASILAEVESLPRSILFWRSFTHWIGGMGVLVFIMAVLPLAKGGSGLFLMRAESPGPDVGKLVPKAYNTARILYGIYLGMTAIMVILLLCGGEPLFDSLTLTFGSAGTGGFGIKNDSVASYSQYTKIVITVFMALFGVNFNLYFLILCGKIKDFFKSEELRAYFAIMIGSMIFVTINISHLYGSFSEAISAATFQVSSVMTTTGYTTANFDLWPDFSKMLMLVIMCIGTCAGSTGGGIKVSRIVLMLKNIRRELKHLAHPRTVRVITFDDKLVSNDVLHGTNMFLIIYIAIFVVSVLIVSLDSMGIVSDISGVIATLNNIGPGLEKVGAVGNYSCYSPLSEIVFIFDMLLGRLEIFPLLLLFTPSVLFKRKSFSGNLSKSINSL